LTNFDEEFIMEAPRDTTAQNLSLQENQKIKIQFSDFDFHSKK
jgi:hypothetical protein